MMLNQKQPENLLEGNIKEKLFTTPILVDREHPDIKKVGNFYLPFDTGIEIEAPLKSGVTNDIFDDVPYLIENKTSGFEMRFRIPKGIKGFMCLFYLSSRLKKIAELNPSSGIHYHIDCNSFIPTRISNPEEFGEYHKRIADESDYILKELESWGYKGSYNRKTVSTYKGSWVRVGTQFNTVEFRIGEMTFDYNLLITRITHCQQIINKIKKQIFIPVRDRYDYDESVIKNLITNRKIRVND